MSGEMVTVTFTWSNEHGLCSDCGELPAAYFLPDLTFTNVTDPANPLVVKGQKMCPICAALHASYGERLERLWQDDDPEEEAPERCGEGPHGEPCDRIIEFGECPVHGEVGP